MKYRLKHDHSKTLEVDEASAPKMSSWRHVSYRDTQLHSFWFDVPRVFLEETGWEPVPEKEPSIDEELEAMAANYSENSPRERLLLSAAAEIRRLKTECHIRAVDEANARMAERTVEEKARHRLDVPCNEFCCLPEVNPSHYCTPTEAYQLLEVNRIEMEKLKATRDKALKEVVSDRDAARKDSDVLRKMHNDLWKKYIDVIRCNAEIGTALVEKMTEK